MGAKQSKRSVDISGKEAESAGEVAAAGAGGEGRVEQLADADALKPQINGDAHIHEKSDKEKELDCGTPENEKDAITEKEAKSSEDEKEIEAAAVTNGETEQKADNGEAASTPEEGKKPKKEKVKKKWSLRSISFSRKDKPKQEKKQKEEEAKTNGEPEKVPEEAVEATTTTPEVIINDVSEDKTESETKEKTPETPVTEPITNGSSTPESPRAETEDSATVSLDNDKPEPKAETEPEQLPVNGLSLQEHKLETPKVESKPVESVDKIPEEPAAEPTPEIAPTPEISVKEVCVDQMPLIEPTPPPLPANPPPSSVASFAATTMAPELADASLSNTAVSAIPTPPPPADVKADEVHFDPPTVLTNSDTVTELTTTKEPANHDLVEMKIDKPEVSAEIPTLQVPSVVESVNAIPNMEEDLKTFNDAKINENNKVVVSAEDKTQIVEPLIEVQTIEIHEVKVVPTDEPIQTPQAPIQIPEATIQAPEETIQAPEETIQAPEETIHAPEETIQAPEETIHAPEGTIQAPKEPIQMVKETIQATEEIIQAPEGTIQAPKEPIQMVKVTIQATEETIHAPEETIQTPKEPIQMVKETIQATEETIQAPEETIQAPKVNILAPEEPIVMAKETIRTAEDIIHTPDELMKMPENENIQRVDDDKDVPSKTKGAEINSNHIAPHSDKTEVTDLVKVEATEEKLDNQTKDVIENGPETIECNGNIEERDDKSRIEETPTAGSDAGEESRAEQPLPPPMDLPQEPVPVSDKMADLIPELPTVPELKTESLQETSDVAVAN